MFRSIFSKYVSFFIVLFLLVSSILTVTKVFGEMNFVFNQNLKLGDSSADVLQLQKVLNQNPATQIAVSGVGSLGYETYYFGNLTKSAVIKFQELYAGEVLTSSGLSSGTGFVGLYTRVKLNSLLSPSPVSTPTVKPIPTVSPLSGSLMIKSASPSSVREGDTIKIQGSGFSRDGNLVILRYGFSEKRFNNVLSSDGKTLSVTYSPVISLSPAEAVNSLSASAKKSLEAGLKKSNVSLDTALDFYQGINSEAELKTVLEKQGKTLKDLEDPYTIIVQNKTGTVVSSSFRIYGRRHFPFDN